MTDVSHTEKLTPDQVLEVARTIDVAGAFHGFHLRELDLDGVRVLLRPSSPGLALMLFSEETPRG